MSTEARFATGDWYAVVGERVTVLLPGSRRDRVAGLWDLADSGADADAVLDALEQAALGVGGLAFAQEDHRAAVHAHEQREGMPAHFNHSGTRSAARIVSGEMRSATTA